MDAEPPARWATFDCYGTLIDWETGLANALHDLWPAADAAGLLDRFHQVEPEVERAQPGLPYRDVLAEVLRRLAAERNLPLTAGQEGALAARIREERQQREELQVRLAAVARATDPTHAGEQPIDELERRLVTLRDELQRPDLVG